MSDTNIIRDVITQPHLELEGFTPEDDLSAWINPDPFAAALEEFSVRMASAMAGLTAENDEIDPLDPHQLALALFAALAVHAETLEGYQPGYDLAEIIELGIHSYVTGLSATTAMLVAEPLAKEE